MKHALISDIHGNLEALTAVLRHIDDQGVDLIHCLGDVVGYGSDPSACLELVNRHCDTKLMGNHEFTALGLQSAEMFTDAAREAVEWTRQQLSDRELTILADFALDRVLDDMYMVHASAYEPDHWHYIFTAQEAALAFECLKQKICFCGHSHIPAIIREGPNGPPRSCAGHDFLPDRENRYLVNVGSVGQPRDNDPRACYMIFDDSEYEVFLNRVEYDISSTQRKMTEARLPETLISRLAAGH